MLHEGYNNFIGAMTVSHEHLHGLQSVRTVNYCIERGGQEINVLLKHLWRGNIKLVLDGIDL